MFFNKDASPAVVFYRPPTQITFIDNFEYSDNWPETIENVDYYITYSFVATNSQQDSFEAGDGW